jgi:hypothetical protein
LSNSAYLRWQKISMVTSHHRRFHHAFVHSPIASVSHILFVAKITSPSQHHISTHTQHCHRHYHATKHGARRKYAKLPIPYTPTLLAFHEHITSFRSSAFASTRMLCFAVIYLYKRNPNALIEYIMLVGIFFFPSPSVSYLCSFVTSQALHPSPSCCR